MPLFPMIVTSLKILNPSMHGKDNTRIRMQFMMQAFLLDKWNESMQLERMFSNTAITVEKLAKVMKRKKRLPHKMPPFMFTKTLGKVIKIRLGKIIADTINKGEAQKLTEESPLVILMIGINGGGKTTSIGKIAHKLKGEGRKVMLAAADTLRAAAGEQLSIWGDRVGVNVVRHGEGADPSAVIYDAIQSAKAKGMDVLICDTAGRLQNKKNLMDELNKMNKVISREWPEAARENLLVLDATTGKNAVSQVEEFGEVASITGIVLTKLDGTAKGGIVITIADEFDMPVKFVGLGEGIDDLKEFDTMDFANGIFAE